MDIIQIILLLFIIALMLHDFFTHNKQKKLNPVKLSNDLYNDLDKIKDPLMRKLINSALELIKFCMTSVADEKAQKENLKKKIETLESNLLEVKIQYSDLKAENIKLRKKNHELNS